MSMYPLPGYLSEILIGALSALVTGFLTWFFSRKKLATEVEALELDLVERAVKMWREQSEILYNQVIQIRSDLNQVSTENQNLRKENDNLKKEIETLKRRLNKYEKQHPNEQT